MSTTLKAEDGLGKRQLRQGKALGKVRGFYLFLFFLFKILILRFKKKLSNLFV